MATQDRSPPANLVGHTTGSSGIVALGPEVQQFLERFRGNPPADREPLYALPSSLLDAIESCLPGWLTTDAMGFERELAAFCELHRAVAIAGGRTVSHEILLPTPAPEISRELFEELGWERHMSYQQACRAVRLASERLSPIHDQQEAYLGWLLTNSQFLEEVASLRARQDAEVEDSGSLTDASPLFGEFASFCRRWQLVGMATWELPIPQGPNLSGIPFPRHCEQPDTDVGIVTPVTMRLPARYPIREIASEVQRRKTPDHLNEWLRVLEGGENRPGLRRFARMFPLHFYRNVVLLSRYGSGAPGIVPRLDEAFATFFGGLTGDSVKRLRTAIQRRLRAQRES